MVDRDLAKHTRPVTRKNCILLFLPLAILSDKTAGRRRGIIWGSWSSELIENDDSSLPSPAQPGLGIHACIVSVCSMRLWGCSGEAKESEMSNSMRAIQIVRVGSAIWLYQTRRWVHRWLLALRFFRIQAMIARYLVATRVAHLKRKEIVVKAVVTGTQKLSNVPTARYILPSKNKVGYIRHEQRILTNFSLNSYPQTLPPAHWFIVSQNIYIYNQKNISKSFSLKGQISKKKLKDTKYIAHEVNLDRPRRKGKGNPPSIKGDRSKGKLKKTIRLSNCHSVIS